MEKAPRNYSTIIPISQPDAQYAATKKEKDLKYKIKFLKIKITILDELNVKGKIEIARSLSCASF